MSTSRLGAVQRRVQEGVARIVAADDFVAWLGDQTPADGDLIELNNSFVYRKPLVRTSKNTGYLALKVAAGRPQTEEVLIARPGDFDPDFKLFSARRTDFPSAEPLSRALPIEVERLGKLLFVLIGTLHDDEHSVGSITALRQT